MRTSHIASVAKLDAARPTTLDAVFQIGAAPSLWDGLLVGVIPTLQAKIPNLAIKVPLAKSDTRNAHHLFQDIGMARQMLAIINV